MLWKWSLKEEIELDVNTFDLNVRLELERRYSLVLGRQCAMPEFHMLLGSQLRTTMVRTDDSYR